MITRDSDRHADVGMAPDLFEYERAGGKEHKICEGRFGDWSPDGKRLVFSNQGEVTDNGGTHWGLTLFIAKADGSDPKRA